MECPSRSSRSALPAALIPDRVCPSARLGTDLLARSAARVNGAMTRAEANLDEVVGVIAPKIVADYSRPPRVPGAGESQGSPAPAVSLRPCIECGKLSTGSRGDSGEYCAVLCQACRTQADAALFRRLRDTDQVIKTFARKVSAPVVTPEFDFDAPVCGDCGCTKFIDSSPSQADPEVGMSACNGGLECDDCGKFYERDAAPEIEDYDRLRDSQISRDN